ncbi:MAG: hypothetical protein JNJ60_14015 [Rhodocyclaceae bacterium]|nr:hypothetical protein [Rhodocyclaceae bacterium]
MKNAPARPLAVLRAMEPALPDCLTQALADYRVNLSGSRGVKVREPMPGWIADEHVVCGNGIMLLAAGSAITETTIATMQRLVIHQAIHAPIRMRGTGARG